MERGAAVQALATGAPDRYAVLDTDIDWGDHAEIDEKTAFGAAFIANATAARTPQHTRLKTRFAASAAL